MPNKRLTPEQQRSFDENGFLIGLPPVFGAVFGLEGANVAPFTVTASPSGCVRIVTAMSRS